MLFFSYILYLITLLPLALATFGHGGGNKPVCGTSVCTVTRTATVKDPNPSTVTSTCGGACFTTVTKLTSKPTYVRKTTTVHLTKTPTCVVTGKPTKTVTQTRCVATSTVCVNHWKREDIPDDMSNGERVALGLPVRSPEERKRTFWGHGGHGGNNGPSCTPTTITSTTTKTKTVCPTITMTKTTCMWTKTCLSTSYVPQTTMYTCTDYVTGPATTITKPCLFPTTTTVKQTATVTRRCW